ncbi:MAG: hypothetical protein J6B99_06970 [Oscillospiraceae bacterium]|nr:hypothetical protein [Oscillospiraceae bacterium]
MSEYNSAYTGAQIDEAVRKSLADVENPVASFNGRKGAVMPQNGDYTAEMVGLGNVPNVATNDQTPTYTAASAPAALTSGEKLSNAFGKITAAISALITHLADSVRHVTAAERNAWNGKSNFSGSYNDLTNKPTIPTVPTKVSAFDNDKGYLTRETDPSVPAWAKNPTKPTYTASEVGAIASSQKGAVGGVASLDNDGKVPTGQLPATMPPAAHKASHMTGGSDELSPADIGAAAVSTIVTATLAANGWSNGAYILTVSGVTATSNQEILPAVNITAEQLGALQAANIQDGGQTAGNITLKAYGDVPTIDIPIRVIKRGD